MKTFKQLREECDCKDKERKGKKKKGNVEVMPTVNDGQKGMTSTLPFFFDLRALSLQPHSSLNCLNVFIFSLTYR